MTQLIARKAMFYKARRLHAGDEFEAKPLDAKILVAIGKARPLSRNVGALDPPPRPVAAVIGPPPEHDAERDALRTDAEKLGIDVDGRWGPARLRQEIERASAGSPAEQILSAVRQHGRSLS